MTTKKSMSFAGITSIAGAVSMLIGAAFWIASGTDLWQALADNQMEIYLAQLPDVSQLLVLNTSFWVLGVLLMATAATLMATYCTSNPALAQMGKVFSRTGASIAIVSFLLMLSLAVVNSTVDIATIIGWTGTRLDGIATMLIIGFSPLFLSIAGRADWVPGWLYNWGFLAGLAGVLCIISAYTGIIELEFVIIPIGIGWKIAAGIVLIKRSKSIAG